MPPIESIVHEYIILYSNRIHQKDKKWLDGVLKFYEFNRKLEILDEDQIQVILTDFIVGNMLASHMLKENSQFKLTNGKYLIEVLEKKSTYTRLLQNTESGLSLANVILKTPQVKLKIEPMVKIEPKSEVRARPIGLRRVKGSQTPIKALISTPMSSTTPSKTPIKKITIKKELESPNMRSNRVTRMPPLKIVPVRRGDLAGVVQLHNVKSGVTSTYTSLTSPITHTSRKIEFSDLHVPHSNLPRIHPRSTNHFQHLPQKTTIKKERDEFILEKNLDSADIIYDLSDYERDIRFEEMLRKRKKLASNDSVEYGISSSSDFDDVDN